MLVVVVILVVVLGLSLPDNLIRAEFLPPLLYIPMYSSTFESLDRFLSVNS